MSSRVARSVAIVAPGRGIGWYVVQGAVGGIVGSVVMGMLAMLGAVLTGASIWAPVRMIGATALGPQALDPSYPLMNALLAMMAVHMMLSAMYGVGIAALLRIVPGLASSRAAVIGTASVVGLILWPINFYVFAPLFGWTWFPENSNALVQIVAHTMFGVAVGVYLAAMTRQSAEPKR